jgi:uncharacterized Zn finger protein
MAKRRSRSRWDDDWPTYTSSGPIRVDKGIKAQSQRGQFVKNWWASRWIAALTTLMDPARLSRGRSYARQGQVLEIDVQPGLVLARVQGSRRTPYKVNIRLKPLSDDQWTEVLDALAEQAIFSAQLLNGEMPPDVVEVFDSARVPLFPAARGDLNTDCSCPDWVNPCKHIAAVYYLLGERFDEDPFLLFELRGRSKKQVMAELRERRVQGEVLQEGSATYALQLDRVETPGLAASMDRYWAAGPELDEVVLSIIPPQVEMAPLKRLGNPDFVGAESFWTQMERAYRGVTERALETAFSESSPEAGQLASDDTENESEDR